MSQPTDFPKLESPFVRKTINGMYVVTPEITPGYEWVFEDERVIATEKLDGTNVSIVIKEGTVIEVWNRTERLPLINKGKRHIIEGILEANERGYCNLPDGRHFGELIGPKLNGNPLQQERHVWIPFQTYAKNSLAYKSWGKYPKTYAAISTWFKDDLFSLFMMKRGIKNFPPEGIVFHHPDGRMAKLRRDMFLWYSGPRHNDGI